MDFYIGLSPHLSTWSRVKPIRKSLWKSMYVKRAKKTNVSKTRNVVFVLIAYDDFGGLTVYIAGIESGGLGLDSW